MNKSEFITEVARVSGVTKADAERVMSAFEEVVISALKADDKVQLTGFGVFESKARAARTVRNPATGAMMDIAATRVASFKAGKRLKDAMESENK
jgi:DNA-binding protein HU-beta